jgi:hypothetical protein
MQITTEEEINVNPVLNFFFALKAPESKRQYPKRFEKFLDYLTGESSTTTEYCAKYGFLASPDCW